MTRSFLPAGAAALALCLGAAGAVAQDKAGATANLIDARGETVGQVSIAPVAQGAHVVLSGSNLPPGVHGFHIHETGKCDPADGFKSAGGHFNPAGRQHGWQNPEGHHAGDLPNVHVAEDGTVAVEFFLADLPLGADSPLFDADGAAVVMHQNPDDYSSDPAGNAGDRIACGVIERQGN